MIGTWYWDLEKSSWPVLCVNTDHDHMLLSKVEFGGDYYWCDRPLAKCDNICQEISALGQFGDWFYHHHKNLYQEMIVKTLYYLKHNI